MNDLFFVDIGCDYKSYRRMIRFSNGAITLYSCSNCKAFKPSDHFTRSSRNSIGVERTCKVCDSVRRIRMKFSDDKMFTNELRKRGSRKHRRVSTLDGGEMVYECTSCGEMLSRGSFYEQKHRQYGVSQECKDCTCARQRNYKARRQTPAPQPRKRDMTPDEARKHKEDVRNRRMKIKYGITASEFDNMFEQQGGVCAICGTSESGGFSKKFHMDHCHATGMNRSVLCYRCNIALGHCNDDTQLLLKMVAYINNWKNIHGGRC